MSTVTEHLSLGVEFTPQNRKEQILYAALATIAERGLSGLSHRAIAKYAAISLGSTTYYFKSIEEIQLSAYELFKEMTRGTIDKLHDSSMGALKSYLHNKDTGRQELIDFVVNTSMDYLSMLISEQLPLRKIEAAFMHAALVNPVFGVVLRERQDQFLEKSESWFGFVLPNSSDANASAHVYVATMHHLEKCQTLAENKIVDAEDAARTLRFLFERIIP